MAKPSVRDSSKSGETHSFIESALRTLDAEADGVTALAKAIHDGLGQPFIAAVEMQRAGEPFAEAMGRDLGGYTRDFACQDATCQASLYADPSLADPGDGVIYLAGHSSAIESYEYSKQPMNNIAFESGAGTSLLFGPVLNPTGATGADALELAGAWFAHMAGGSNAGGRYVQAVSPGTPLGWPGLWPVLQPFSSWNPAIAPT